MAEKHPKEAFYDEKISPLMAQIIALCKEAKINMVADFSLGPDPNNDDEPMFCTTSLPNLDPDDEAGMERMTRAYRTLRPRSDFMAFTIIGGNRD